jgi:2-oxo-4-hydroxy-4-carboxy-5-ureidoimidazoline decarboxylase
MPSALACCARTRIWPARLAIAGELTAESKSEQAGAGLDRLSAEEHARFTELNSRYMRDFGFPFIIAVKGLDKDTFCRV